MCEEGIEEDKDSEGWEWEGILLHSVGSQLKLECQSELLFDMFERYWDFFEMISDYYIKNPDSNVRIVTKDRDEEDGGGKQPADDGGDEDSSDEDEEE